MTLKDNIQSFGGGRGQELGRTLDVLRGCQVTILNLCWRHRSGEAGSIQVD